MKVSVKALKEVLKKQVAAIDAQEEKDHAASVKRRRTELGDAIAKAKRYISDAQELLAADGDRCLGELRSPPHFYPERERNRRGGDVRKALRLLDLAQEDSLSLSEASRIVGKSVLESL